MTQLNVNVLLDQNRLEVRDGKYLLHIDAVQLEDLKTQLGIDLSNQNLLKYIHENGVFVIASTKCAIAKDAVENANETVSAQEKQKIEDMQAPEVD